MLITLSISTTFLDDPRYAGVAQSILREGYNVIKPDKNVGGASRTALVRKHFDSIKRADALYVVNFTKGNRTGYIGPSCLMEMGVAFDYNKPIFLYHELPKNFPSLDELKSLEPIVIGQDWPKMHKILNPEVRNTSV